MPLSPMDEFMAHQTCETFDHVFTSDRNFYDRYYFNMHSSSDELFLIAGMGQYPNLGTTDAFVSVSHGESIYVVRASRELGSNRLDTQVGPFGTEVLEGLKKVRVWCEDNEHGISFDLVFEGTVPAIEEPKTFQRHPHGRVSMDTSRYAQVGTWTGTLRVAGQEYEVTPDKWRGARDHSWGVRGIGEPEPPGIRASQVGAGFGFFHTWIPLQLDDCLYKLFSEQDKDGGCLVEESAKVGSFASGGKVEAMGKPTFDYKYKSGTRELDHAIVTFDDPSGQTIEVRATPLRTVYLAAGSGYIPQPDWSHGMYQGPLKVEGKTYDVSTEEARAALGPLYEVLCRFELSTGEVSYGLLEALCVGSYHPFGFDSPGAMAP
ncbi:MAG: hypothetical protein ACI8W3_001004 [Myxococcota bacterium]|jgi:hypothetical protein